MTKTFQAHYLTIDGALTFVEEWGPAEGAVILAIHTAGQSGVQYRESAPQLAQLGYRVIVPDFPGHGRSEPHAGGPVTNLGRYAEHCLKVLDLLEINEFAVVGCSIGGKIGLDIGIRSDGRVQAIVAMAANADNGFVNIRAMQRELNDISTPSRTDRTYWGTRAVVGASVDEERRELIAKMHCREDPSISTSDLIAWGNHDIFSDLPKISAPTLVVAGEDDLWINSDSVKRTANEIPKGHFHFLPGVGHYPMEEMPDFADFVHTWLSEQSAFGTGTGS